MKRWSVSGRPGQRPERRALLFAWWNDRRETDHAWKVPVDVFKDSGFNLDVKNPRAPERLEHLPPGELVESILTKEVRITQLVGEVRELLGRDAG
jgi:type I restriction enzyme M protein